MLENEDGVDFLPMRVVAILIVSSLILVAVATYTSGVIGQWSKASARACASKIIAMAKAEYSQSCPDLGDGACFDVTVPASVITMTFGPAPANIRTDAPGQYSIQYSDGSKELHISGVPLGSGSTGPGRGGPLVLVPGRYSVRIVTEAINDTIMALIYVEAT